MRSFVVIACIAATSCGDPSSTGGQQQTPSTTPSIGAITQTAVDGPVMRYPTPSNRGDGMAAEVSGVLQLEGPCLYILVEKSGERYPVLWPSGTRWDDPNRSVVPPAGPPMPIGSRVYGAGGYLYVADIERLAGSDAAAAAAACVDNTYSEVAVVNNADTAIALDDT